MKNKLKALPATIRQKKRYIALKTESEKELNTADMPKLLWQEMILLTGHFGTAESGFWIIEASGSKNTSFSIIACEVQKYEKVRAALTLITYLGNSRVRPKVLGVSGTLKKLRTKYLKNTVHY